MFVRQRILRLPSKTVRILSNMIKLPSRQLAGDADVTGTLFEIQKSQKDLDSKSRFTRGTKYRPNRFSKNPMTVNASSNTPRARISQPRGVAISSAVIEATSRLRSAGYPMSLVWVTPEPPLSPPPQIMAEIALPQWSLPGTDQMMDDQRLPEAASTAPQSPPTSACEELEGRPDHQVIKFHAMAASMAQHRTGMVAT